MPEDTNIPEDTYTLDNLAKAADYIALVFSAPPVGHTDRTPEVCEKLREATEEFASWLHDFGITITTSIGQNGMLDFTAYVEDDETGR